MIKKLFLLFLILVLLSGCAQAAPRVSVYTDYIRCYETNYEDHDLVWLESNVNNTSIITHDGTTWYLNRSLQCYSPHSFRVGGDPTTATKLVLGDGRTLTWGHCFYISELEIVGGGEIGTRSLLHDVHRHDGGRIRLDYMANDIYNITMENTTGGVSVANSNEIKVYNISVTNSTSTGVSIATCNNTEAFNIRVEKIGDYTKGFYLAPATGKYAFIMTGCRDSVAHDIHGNNTAWSGIEITSPDTSHLSHNITYYNMTMGYAGHNGFDFHSGGYSLIYNITSHDNPHDDGNNILVAGVNNYTLRNVTSYNSGISKGILIGSPARDVYLENYTSDNDGCAIGVINSTNITIRNTNITRSKDYAIKLSNVLIASGVYTPGITDFTLFDAIASTGIKQDIWTQNTTNTHLINFKYNDGLYYYDSIFNYDSNFYYYLDLVGKYANGTVINGTVAIYNDTFISRDANGNLKTDFLLTSGRTELPFFREYSAAIPEKHRSRTNNTTTTVNSIQNTITVSDGEKSVILDKVTPDIRWYRSNNSQPEYTIVALFNDSNDLHFTGYAPSTEYNIFEEGETVKLQVWANEPLDYVSWKKDGVDVQNSTSTTYETTLSDVPITVDISGSSPNGTVSKTWIVDPEQIIEPEPEGNAPVANFTSNVTTGGYPLKVSFTDTSTETPLNWYWDFDNDGYTDSRLQNPAVNYKAKGNYTAKLTVSNAAGMDIETKTQYIQVTGSTLTKIPYFSSFSNWLNSFYRQYLAALGMWLCE